jgi:hypothetical protein
MVAVGTNPLPRKEQSQEHRRTPGGLDALGGEAERGGEPRQRQGEECQHPKDGEPRHRTCGRPETERHGDDDHDGEADDSLDEAGQRLTCQHGGAGDRRGAEPVDDPARHSMATTMAVPWAAAPTVMSRMPGVT